ncbi:hypothetical protein OROGR_010135 [Orobanche gracilis]
MSVDACGGSDGGDHGRDWKNALELLQTRLMLETMQKWA